MNEEFRFYTYKDYKLLIRSITSQNEEKNPDMFQEILLGICKMEKDILDNKITIRNNNLFNYVYGYIKRTYLNLDKKYNKHYKLKNKYIINKDISELNIEDPEYISEDYIINTINIQNLLNEHNLTEEEKEFYSYYTNSKINKKSVKLELNLTEEEYNKLRKSVRYKLKERKGV